MSAVKLQGITASFGGERVLGPLSLNVEPGEHVALVGRSGAGKSTLLKLIYDQLQSRSAYVPQELGLVQSLPVFHNVFMARLDKHPAWYNLVTLFRPFRRERADIVPLLEDLGMQDKLWSPVASLSGGQKQRTAIARALYQHADILLADEPVSALDGPLAIQVMTLLRDQFSTSVIALHDVELALEFCDRIIGIEGGGITLDEPCSQLTAADIAPLY